MSYQTLISTVPVLAVFIIIYFNTMARIAGTWTTYQGAHGPLILAISVYMIWTKRAQLKITNQGSSIFPGVLLTLSGCLLLVAGTFGSILLLQYISLIVTVSGLVLLMLGVQYFKILWYPVIYLIFMFPIFSEILSGLSIYLQNTAAVIAFNILRLFDVAVFRAGHILELPNVTLSVARECNGINQIMALISLAFPLAYWTLDSGIKKAILIGSAAVLGIIANGIRIAVIGLWAVYSGNNEVHGPYDIFYVSFIFFFGMFALVTMSSLMGTSKEGKKGGYRALPVLTPLSDRGNAITAMTEIIIMSATALYLHFLMPGPVYLSTPISKFPLELGQWKGHDTKFTEVPFSYFRAENEIRRIYRDPSGNEATLYIGYFPEQGQDREIVHYRFDPLQLEAEKVSIPTSAGHISVNKTILTISGNKMTTYFWYDINGRIITNRYTAKIMTIIDAIFYRRTNAAIVVVSMNNMDDEGSSAVVGDVLKSAGKFLEVR